MNAPIVSKVLQFVLASLLVLMLFYATRFGLGLSPDSMFYIKAADGLLSGKGIEYMSAQWPPLYPLMLSVFGYIVNGDLFLGGRILNAILIGINYLLIVQLLRQYLNIDKITICILAMLLSLHEALLYVEFYSWSEPLVISIILSNFLIIKKYIDSDKSKSNYLEVALIIFATLAVSTRYIGINVAFINAVVVLIYTRSNRIDKKILHAGMQVVLPTLIIYPWLAWHRGVDDDYNTKRMLQYHPISLEQTVTGIKNLGRWVYPSASKFQGLVPEWLFLITGLVILLLMLYFILNAIKILLKKYKNIEDISLNKKKIMLGIVGLFILFYLAFLLLTMSFVDKKLTIENRLLSPIFVPVFLLILGIATTIKKQTLRYLAYIVFSIIMTFSYFNLRSWLLLSYFNGIEINARSNINKEIFKKIKLYSTNCQLYSDQPWNISWYFETKVRWLPTIVLFGTGLYNEQYKIEIDKLKDNANIVLVENKKDLIIKELDTLDGFERIYEDQDGILWRNNTLIQCADR